MSNNTGCTEYNELSRRHFLGTSAKVAAATALLPAWMPKLAFAEDYNASRDVLVFIYLRGGCDGLSMVVPFGDPDYAPVRPTIALSPPDRTSDQYRTVNLDGYFGFPQALKGLVPAYLNGDLLLVQATGSVDPTKSHFDAQKFMEVGKPNDQNIATGWIARHLQTSSQVKDGAPLRAIGFGGGLQASLYGGPLTIPVSNPSGYGIAGNTGNRTARQNWLADSYNRTIDPLKSYAENTLNTISMLNKLDFNGYRPAGSAAYNTNVNIGQQLRYTAKLIKSDVGLEVAAIDYGGWDTHNQQNPKNGSMSNTMAAFGTALSAFYEDLKTDGYNNVVTIVVSEFGRNVQENTSQGTDHGHGNMMMVLGGGIKGGQVINSPRNPNNAFKNWPGLSRENRDRGVDLKVTVDHRDLLAEIVQKRLANDNLPFIFPDYAWNFLGITK